MNILAIETSCDETAIAIVQTNASMNRMRVLAEPLLSQIALHAEYGGVFPALAKREHAKAIVPLLKTALTEAGLYHPKKVRQPLGSKLTKKIQTLLAREENTSEELINLLEYMRTPKIDAIAVTSGPGLEPALWVGINTALALSSALDVPLYPVNHMEGHMYAGALISEKNAKGETVLSFPDIAYPILTLLISGGHTELVLTKNNGKHTIVGATRDDAVGEAFDKVARVLGIPYPGGPEVSRRAKLMRDSGVTIPKQDQFPRPMLHTPDFDFSFSGLKTSVLYRTQKIENMTDEIRNTIALDFENAVTEVIVKKTMGALEKYSAQTLIVGGGVSANTEIRKRLTESISEVKKTIYLPKPKDATDNALMIAVTAVKHIKLGKKPKKKVIANGNWKISKT